MATVTYDGRSFLLDGRRIWIVSGTICYASVPRANWRDRIHAARLAGLNAVEVPVVWARHEVLPRQFDFEGDNDLRHFIELIHEAGLHCILRPGPYIGGSWDFGGLPPWIRTLEGVRIRGASSAFLEPASRFITAVAEQVRHLQVTSTGKGGPILLVQNEAGWTCGDDAEGRAYLGELNRFLRESGFSVPIVNANNLWQSPEGEIDGWVAGHDLIATTRQLGAVRPLQPKLVIGLQIIEQPAWGADNTPPDPPDMQRRVAEVLAAGGQFNLRPFFGGTHFGFSAGRIGSGPASFATTSADGGAPLAEHGGAGAAYGLIRRLCMFASSFSRVLSNLDPTHQPVVMKPDEGARAAGALSVVHSVGSQGQVVWVFAGGPARRGSHQLSLLLPDGSSLPITLGSQRVLWCLFDVHLGGRTRLDFSSLSALVLRGDILAVFGPSGTDGLVSINGSVIQVDVPTGKTPSVLVHEDITLVVMNEDQVDRCFLTEKGLLIGASSIKADGTPIAEKNARVVRVQPGGDVVTITVKAEPQKPLRAPTLSEWTIASASDYADGSSARYAAINGPDDLISLGTSAGYGWYRTEVKSSAAKKTRVAIPQSADRVHVYLSGELMGVLGVGRGAKEELSLPIKRTPQPLVLLAENLGRRSEGSSLGEPKGVFGHAMEIRTIRLTKPAIEEAEPVNVLAFRTPLWEMHAGELTSPHRITWKVMHRKRTPIILSIGPLPVRAVLVLNDEPIEFLDRGARDRIVLHPEQLKRGANRIQVAALSDDAGPLGLDGPEGAEELAKQVAGVTSAHEGVSELTGKAKWSFARWEPPAAAAYETISKNAMRSLKEPAWWRTEVSIARTDVPLYLDLTGMTKGQVFLNGRHLGRFWVASPDGKSIGAPRDLLLPEAWLHHETPNELVLFDEHGGNPSRCRVHYDRNAIPIRA